MNTVALAELLQRVPLGLLTAELKRRKSADLERRRAENNAAPFAPLVNPIIAAVATAFEVPAKLILSPTRNKAHVCEARAAAMLIARQSLQLGLRDLAFAFRRLNHCTVSHNLRIAEAASLANPDFHRRLELARRFLNTTTQISR